MYLKHSTPLYWMKSPVYLQRFRGQTVAIAIDGLRGVINIADDIWVYV